MELLMNGLLLAATCFAGSYCWVLAGRVRDLKSLDKGLGGAIVTLTRQVELARTTLEEARASSRDTKQELAQLVQRADAAAGQLRLLIAAGPQESAAPRARVAEPARREPTLRAEAESPQGSEPGPAPRVARHPAAGASRQKTVPVTIPSLDRLVAGPLAGATPRESEPEAPRTAVPHLAEVPKPRALAPIENPLRRVRPTRARPLPEPTGEAADEAAAGSSGSEDAILEALSALAGGR